MGATDRSVRNEAVTLRANIFGHNYRDETEYDLTVGALAGNSGGYSDLCPMLGINPVTFATGVPTVNPTNSLRIMQPHYGEVVECYLDFIMLRSATDIYGSTEEKGGLGMYIAIGDFTDNNFMTPRTTYTLDEIKASWLKISGRTLPIAMLSGGGDWRLIGRKLNLLPALYKNGHAKFVEDGFNLIIAFGDPGGNMLYAPIAAGAGTNFAFESFRLLQSITGIK